MKKTILLIVLATYTCILFSQQQWNLEQCIEYGIENNIQIKQQDLQVELKDKQLLQSKVALAPDLNASATNVYNYGRTIDYYTNDWASDWVRSNNFYLSMNLTLFNGFQLLNTIKQKNYDHKAAMHNADRMRNDVSLQIATAYLQILFNIELLKTAENQLNITKEQVSRSEKLLAAGTITNGDLLQMEAQNAAEELQVVNAQNNLDISYLTLIQMLNLDSAKDFEIVQPKIQMPVNDLIPSAPEEIYNIALGGQPEIKSAEANMRSSEVGLKISKAGYYPYLNFRLSYGSGFSGASNEVTGYNFQGFEPNGNFTSAGDTVFSPLFDPIMQTTPFGTQIDNNLNYSLGFYLSIPLFNKLQTKTAVDAARINVLNSKYSFDNEKKTLFKAIQQAHSDASGAVKRYAAAKKSVDALKKTFEYTEQKFNVGMVNSVDYSDAKNKLAKAESDLLQAKYEYIFD